MTNPEIREDSGHVGLADPYAVMVCTCSFKFNYCKLINYGEFTYLSELNVAGTEYGHDASVDSATSGGAG
jgi:hypothetical protein